MKNSDPRVDEDDHLIPRRSLCLSSSVPGIAAHDGNEEFLPTIKRHFSTVESNATEQLFQLKAELATAPIDRFWKILMEGITTILGSQYAFVSKRILVDDQDSAVEMPPLGEPGSCLMGIAIYYNDGDKLEGHHRNFRYSAYGAPCAHMKHDKVFMIPDCMSDFITACPNEFAFPVESYLGIPLFSAGKCFGHLGCFWTVSGLKKRKLSWGMIEMVLHALEDLVAQRIVAVRESFSKQEETATVPTVIPQSVVTAAQSLKPYARSLSHELRTPMQGVIGLLDLMYVTVQEALEGSPSEDVKQVFKSLRDNIEVVQDSSRRAVEAADNVVHAYDLGMQVPDTPKLPDDEAHVPSRDPSPFDTSVRIEEPSKTSRKRRRSDSSLEPAESDSKHRAISKEWSPSRPVSPRTANLRLAVEESEHITGSSYAGSQTGEQHDASYDSPGTLGLRVTKIREIVHVIISECLRVGGRPDSAIAETTETGELIDVRARGSDGKSTSKTVEWSVDRSVPDEILIDADIAKLISVLFLNALKFTEQGRIMCNVTLSRNARYVNITVTDTGSGIPAAFRPNLFKAFSRGDDSITRSSEGLGLGLMVAKGLARRFGGDLSCVRSDTEGPQRGSEFLLRIPLHPMDGRSRHSTPSRTPTPAGNRSTTPSMSERRIFVRARQVTPSRPSIAVPASDGDVAERSTSPLLPISPLRQNLRRHSSIKPMNFDRNLARKCPLNILVAEDNRINRKLLMNMLSKFGYRTVQEAFDGAEAVRLMRLDRSKKEEDRIDVILMDLWMPNMDGYEATERILAMQQQQQQQDDEEGEESQSPRPRRKRVKILAVTADVTGGALERAKDVGMVGHMTKPYKLIDLQRVLLAHCAEAG